MKILVICQYYHPEPFRIADICEELVKRGHDVTVVTGVPNYPEGVVYPGYERGQKRRETIGGVKVHRCFTIPRKTGAVYRLLNYYSYAISASRYVKKLDGDHDVVLVNQLSPVMMAQPGIAYGRKHKVPVVMYCLDLWPESLTAGGISRTSLIYRFFHKVSEKIYKRMDRILVTSRAFSEYLVSRFGVEAEAVDYLPQYAETLFSELPPKEGDGCWNFTFAGNIGEIQSLETVLLAAQRLKDEPAVFHIVGGGTDLERLQKLAKDMELNNVIFHGRRPIGEMPEFYSRADAMLITLRSDPVLSLTLPGKIQSYMAAGRAVIGAVDGEAAAVIREADCGLCCDSGDAEGLADCVRRFMGDPNAERFGHNARKYYEKHFTKERFIFQLEEALKG